MATRVGTRTVARNLRKLAAQVPIVSARALNFEAEETITDAVELTPVDTGRLYRSAKVRPYASASDLVATLTYGTKYAIYVHEIPPPPDKSPKGRSAEHPRGQWKFLETAVDRRASKFSANIAADIRKQLR